MAKTLTVFFTIPMAVTGIGSLGLAAAQPDWQPADPPMLTRWAKDIDPKTPLPEYPRPQLTREDWRNLNGLWDYAVTQQNVVEPDNWDGKILVPYPIESALSGVNKDFLPTDLLHYQRNFEVPDHWGGKRIMLHFGAVDYRSKVYVNGQLVGEHEGGYDPFSFDITDALKADGKQTLTVRVTDPTWTEGIPRGKQTLDPGGIMYIPTSGIWQTVWLEPVNAGAIENLKIVPNLRTESIEVTANLYGGAKGDVTVSVPGQEPVTGQAGHPINVPIKAPRLWSPEDPHLYDMTVTVSRDGKTVDEVGSYFGMRSVGMARIDGDVRLLLNGKPYFMFGPLDQGFWPDGCYTAPTDEALRYDLEVTRELGFNTTRKHIKVEPARWYYHADKLGLLVWQDMPSINSYDAEKVPGGSPELDREAYRTQLAAMIDHLENHPSIVMWVIFNESQGKHDTEELVKLVRRADPTRIVNEDSGYFHSYEAHGDMDDRHPYPAPRLFPRHEDKAFALGEYGGIGLKIGDNNPWQEQGWGYTNTSSSEELENLYAQYADTLRGFRDEHGLTSAIYTQITDVEIEINGLLTYDRQLKVDPKWIAKANRFEWAGPVYTPIINNSQDGTPDYLYTFDKPGDDWMQPDADTRGWHRSRGGLGTQMTPGIGRIGKEWNGSDVWLRRSFRLPELRDEQLDQLVLHLYHDEDAKVYINGVPALEREGFVTTYTQYPISDEAREALKPGEENVIAIHCRQTTGGQYVDVGMGTIDPGRD